MTPFRRGAFIVVIGLSSLAVVSVSCGSSTKKSASGGGSTSSTASSTTKAAPAGHMTAQEIASKLTPLGCNAMPATSNNDTLGGIKPVTELECTISGESVTIDEYVNSQQIAYNNQIVKGAGCALAKGFGVTQFIYVAGSNWTVSASTLPTVQAIQKAIGAGTIVNIKC